MRNSSKLLIAAIAATSLLGIAVSAASAGRIEIVNWERGFRISWNPLRMEDAGRISECAVTVEGSFETHTFAKRAGTGIARLTEAAIGTCTRNTAVVLRETLPWTVTYSSFGGTLPNITSLTWNVIRVSFTVNLEGVECLAATRTEQPARGIASITSGTVTGFRMDETAGIETGGGFFCSVGGKAHFLGAANSITVRGGTEAMSVRLI